MSMLLSKLGRCLANYFRVTLVRTARNKTHYCLWRINILAHLIHTGIFILPFFVLFSPEVTEITEEVASSLAEQLSQKFVNTDIKQSTESKLALILQKAGAAVLLFLPFIFFLAYIAVSEVYFP